MAEPVLLLDVMGTLVEDPFYEVMPAFFGMSLKELLAEKHPTRWQEFERGEIDSDRFLADFFADGRSYDRAGFVRAVRSAYRLLPGIEDLLRELKAQSVPMHALSNYPAWYRWIEAELGLSRFLAWSFVSCETGLRKPSEGAYRHAAEALGISPASCVFVDDRAQNVDAARETGMHGICFRDAESLRADLAETGLARPR